MAALPVIEHLDVFKEGATGCDLGREGLTGEEFTLQRGEEALGHRVIIAVAHRSHRAANADRLAALAEEQRGVLAAVVRMVNDTLTGSPVPDGHLQCADHKLRAQM